MGRGAQGVGAVVVKEFGTGAVAARDRFPLFQAFMARSHMLERLDSERKDDFAAAMRILDLGDVQVSVLANSHLAAERTPPLIRRCDPEVFQFHFVLRGEGSITQSGNGGAVRSGDAFLLDSSRPYRGEFRSAPDTWSHLAVRCPRALLPLPERSVRRMASVALPADHGMAGVLRRWLTDLNARAEEFTEADVPTLSAVTVDLVASVLAHWVDAQGPDAQEAHRRALRLRVRDFVEQRLGDPDLTPEAVAAAHAISLRSLYRMFQEEGLTVAAWIRERRLERCRLDLADPASRSLPLHAVAARWGFPDYTHFSRAFRAAYGTSPRDYRRTAAAGDGGRDGLRCAAETLRTLPQQRSAS